MKQFLVSCLFILMACISPAQATDILSFSYDESSRVITWRARNESLPYVGFRVSGKLLGGKVIPIGSLIPFKGDRFSNVYTQYSTINPVEIYLYQQDTWGRTIWLATLTLIAPQPPPPVY